MKKYYRDFYGCTASICETRDGQFRLRIASGLKRYAKKYSTMRGARIAMGHYSDCWQEVSP